MASTRSTFSRQLESFTSFDDGSGPMEEDSIPPEEAKSADAAAAQAVAVPSMRPQDLVVATLLELICFIHVQDQLKSKQLFREISRAMVAQGLMAPLGPQQELSSLRAQYKHGFSVLLRTAMDTIAQQNIPVVPPRILQQRAAMQLQPMGQPPRLLDMSGFCNSRYHDEFQEIKVIDKGGFGKVFQAQHNLDKKCYAIKKIPLKRKSDFEKWNKAFREAQNLAELTHPNVVRYHSAWLEHQYSPVNSSDSESESTSATPNIMPVVTNLGCGFAEQMEEDSVVFQHSSSTEDSTDTRNDESSRLVQPRQFLRQHSSPGSLSTTDESDAQESSSLDRALVLAQPCTAAVHQFRPPVIEPVCVCLFIQMELCNETLAKWMRSRNDEPIINRDHFCLVNEKQNLVILKQILNGLAYIHQKNLIHRDIKPKNIFLNWMEGGRLQVKLGDFGLARQVYCDDTPMTPHPGVSETNYYTGSVGTQLYAAPEQLNGSNYDHKSDMFSLGVVLFELYHPFFTEFERTKTLVDLNKGVIPEAFKQRWPKQCSYVQRLISLNTCERPNTEDLINSEIFLSKDKIIQQLRTELTEKNDYISKLEARIRQLELKPSVIHQQTTTDIQMETNTQYCDNSASATTFSSHAETINSTAFASNITNLIQYLQSSSSNPAPKTTTSNHASPGATNLPRTRVPFQRFFAPNTYPQTRNAEWHGDRDRNVTHAGDQNFESTNYARNEDTESGSDRPHEL